MKDAKKFQTLLIGQQKYEDSDYSDHDYKNKNFEIQQKYEKFKPKNKGNYNNENKLKETEIKVKNLISFFLNNIEKENKNSFIVFDDKKSKKSKKEIKKKIPILNCNKLIKSSSLNMDVNFRKINVPKEEKSTSNNDSNQKFSSNFSTINIENNSTYTEKKNNKIKRITSNNLVIINNQNEGSIKFKDRINNFFHRNKSFSQIFKTNKKNKNNNNNLISDLDKVSNQNFFEPNSLFKKNKSFVQKDSYFNFKKNIHLKKEKKENDILKMLKKNKKDVFNESNHNSILSDFSDYNLNKRPSLLEKSHNVFELYKKDNIFNSTNQTSIKKSIKLSKLINKRNSNASKGKRKSSEEIKNKKNQKSNEPIENTENTDNFDVTKNDKNHNEEKSKFLVKRLKTLKMQLKNSILLCPDELDLSLDEENKNKKMLNNSKSLKNKNNENIRKTKTCMSNFKLNKAQMPKPIRKNITFNNLNSAISENKISEDKLNIKRKKTAKSINNDSKGVIFDDNIHKLNGIKEKFRVLIHKPLVYDSLDDEEFEDAEEINMCYIDPNSIFSIFFDSLIFSITIISLLEVPFYLAMNPNFCRKKQISFISLLNLIIELLNIIDLFLGFFRAFYNWEEQLINKNKNMAINYITSWFLFDLIASIPIYTINKLNEPFCNGKELSIKYYNVTLNNLGYFFIINRLFKVVKIFRNNQVWKIISNKINDFGYNYIKIITYIFFLYSSINYTACMFIFIGRNSYPNWIMEAKLQSETFLNIYICSIYVLLMSITTVGYGDITCYSFNEIIFQLLLLFIGIIAYSTAISFFSNMIKKMNEKSIDYENRVAILDEIKRSHPNMPNKLYERILRYLKFKNFYDKKLKNIIFDCLPIGLKNNLISEMYKPIIKNFIFFKNFQNTDFIVRVILAFKPVMAYKNDILVNDGDMVKDIIFVTKGVLAVELPINILNHQENIDKYLKSTILSMEKGQNIQKMANSTMISGKNKKINNNFVKQESNKKNSIFRLSSFINNSTISKYAPTFNTRYSTTLKEIEEKNNIEKDKNITYIRILAIRENEHFGDVLMFLEQKSPLRVRVRSKKSEMFFLRKIDAIKISASYQNIWRRINKKSIYNYEQMKKNIKKIVELYCSVKSIKSNDENKEITSDTLNQSSEENDNGKKKSAKNFNNNSISKEDKKKQNLKYSKSIMIPKMNYFKLIRNLEINDDMNFKKINNKIKKNNSNKILKRNYNLSFHNINNQKSFNSLNTSSSPSSSQISIKISSNNRKEEKRKNNIQNNTIKNSYKNVQKEEDILNNKYKFYKGIKNFNESNKKITIISKKHDQEFSTIHPLQFTNSIQKMNRFSSIKRVMTPKNPKKITFKYKNLNLNNFDIIDNSKEEEEESISSFAHTINKEIYSGEEEIILNNGNSLLSKKIDLDYISTKNENSELNKNSLEQKNSRLEILLNSLEDKNEIIEKSLNSSFNRISSNTQNFDSNKNIINFENNETNYNKSKIILSLFNSSKKERRKIYWDSSILSVNNNISFKFDSLYENFNLIGGKEFTKNKFLQNELKQYLIEKMQKPLIDFCKRNTLKTNSLKEPNTSKNKENTFLPNIDLYKTSSKSITVKKTRHEKRPNNKFALRLSISKKLNNKSMINEKEKNKDLFNTGIFKGTPKNKTRHNSINNYNIYNKNKEFQNKLFLSRNSAVINPLVRPRKKRDNLLSTINLNIQKTNQNLNNPDVFYSNYFNSLLEGEINGKKNNINNFLPSIDMIKRNNIMEKKTKKK